MARVCFVFLVIAVAVVLVNSQLIERCPKNEAWNDCGTACEPSCENPHPDICTDQCIVGCQCKPGFLRRQDGRCVKEEQC